jgi:3-deoxy-D-manno-octulosonic acid kinase
MLKKQSQVIVYDGDCLQEPGAHLFDEQWWRQENLVSAVLKGRGNTVVVDHPEGPMVMRRYLRGGWAAKISHDQYIFTGYARSRPIREYELLTYMRSVGLPVPVPVAALCDRQGVTYRGALLMRKIDNSSSLAERLAQGVAQVALSDDNWRAVGHCIATFHQAGIIHADLNAANILLDGSGRVYLLDFDRGRRLKANQPAGKGILQANLDRLLRSLLKVTQNSHQDVVERGWALLVNEYATTQ